MSARTADRRYLFESAPIPSAVMTLAVPTVITQLITILYNYADTWFVGRTGNPAMVAALSVCYPVYVILTAIANLFGVGGSSVISRLLGKGQTEKARGAFAFCFWFGLATAALYALLMLLFRSRLIWRIGGDANSYPYIYDYILWTMILGAIPTAGNSLCGHLVRSIGAAREAGFGMSLGVVLNCLLDPLFMFVLLPPGHEVTGAAVATLLSNTAAFAYFLVFLRRHRDNPVLTTSPRDIAVGEGIPRNVLVIGLPAALQTALTMVANMAANALVSVYGTEAVSGMGVSMKINMLTFNPTMGLAFGVLPLLGYNIGSGNRIRLRKTVRFTVVAGLVYNLLCVVLFRAFASQLVRFFIDDTPSVQFGAAYLRIVVLAAPPCAIGYLFNTFFQAAGRSFEAYLICFVRKAFLTVPLMFLLGRTLGLGGDGVAAATPIAESVGALVAFLLYLRYMAKTRPPQETLV